MRKSLAGLFLVLTLLVLANTSVIAGVGCPEKSAGNELTVSDWNNCRTDIITGKFYDSSGLGALYIQVLHDGTNASVNASSGDLVLKRGGTAKVTLGNVWTALGNNIGISGSIEVDGAATLDGAITANSTLALTGLATLDAGFKIGSSGDTFDVYEEGCTWDAEWVGASGGGLSNSAEAFLCNTFGNMAFINLYTSTTSGSIGIPLGQLEIALPAAAPSAPYTQICNVGQQNDLPISTSTELVAWTDGGDNTLKLYQKDYSTSPTSTSAYSYSDTDSVMALTISCIYQTTN